MLKSKIIGKKIRNIVILLMTMIIIIGTYRYINSSKAEKVIEISATILDNYGFLDDEKIKLDAKQLENGIYEIELPENINTKKINKIIKVTTEKAETIEKVENKIQLTSEQIASKQINLEVEYDVAILNKNEDGTYTKSLIAEKTEEERKQIKVGETSKTLYGKILRYENQEDGKSVEVKGYLPVDAELQVEEVAQEKITQIFGEEEIKVAYDIKILEKVITEIPGDEANPDAEPEKIEETIEINPKEYGETCEVTITDARIAEKSQVYHVKGDNTYENVNIIANTQGDVSFEAPSFSIYAIADDATGGDIIDPDPGEETGGGDRGVLEVIVKSDGNDIWKGQDELTQWLPSIKDRGTVWVNFSHSITIHAELKWGLANEGLCWRTTCSRELSGSKCDSGWHSNASEWWGVPDSGEWTVVPSWTGKLNSHPNTGGVRIYIQQDTIPPTAGTMTMNIANGTWTNQNITLSLNDGSDGQSGHKSTTYSITKNWAPYVSNQTAARTLTEEGFYQITVTTTDNADNTSTNIYNVGIDKTPPTYSSYEVKNLTKDGFDVYIHGVSDTPSGISAVRFPTWTETNGQDDIIWADGTDLGNGTWHFRVNASQHNNEEGWYQTHIYIYDYASNYNVCTMRNYVDRTPPTTPTITNPSGGNWTNQNVKLSIYSDDSGLKVAKIQYSYDKNTWMEDWDGSMTTSGNRSSVSGTWTAERNSIVYVRAIDNAGNVSGISSTPIKIDKTKPTITLGTNKNETWAKTGSVTVTIGDTSSGLATGANMQYAWSTNGTTAPTSGYKTATISSYSAGAKTATFTASASGLSGKYYLWVKPVTLKDVAGNAQTASVKSTGTFWFDNTAPTLPTYNAFHPSDNKSYTSGTWTNYLVNTTIKSTDQHSGIKEIQYSFNKTNWTKFEFGAGALTRSGTTWSGTEEWSLRERDDYLYFRAVDNLGNTSAVSATPNFNIKYDLTAPTQGTTTASAMYTNKPNVTIYATGVSDALSGVDFANINGFYGVDFVSSFTSNRATYDSANDRYYKTYNFAEIPNTSTGEANQGEGTYIFDGRSYDRAGNVSYIGAVKVVYDVTRPKFTYKYSETDINYGAKTVKVVFSVKDEYFANANLAVGDLKILVDGEEPDWTKVRKEFTSITDVKATIDGTEKVIGKEYTLLLSNLQQNPNDGFNYSGTVTVGIPAGKATDKAGNANNSTMITIGIELNVQDAFEYTGNVQEYIVPETGFYKLEVWGASGGSLIANGSTITANYNGGKGGYSVGEVKLTKGEKLYVAVGGAGVGATEKGQSLAGGFNGGGSVTGDSSVSHMTASGGGATHIAKTNNRGELKNYASNKNEILIAAGGGGGAREQSNHVSGARWGHGGAGGGLQGQGAVSSNGSTTELTELTQLAGTQTSGKAFGLGGNGSINSAGGGGFYGGYGGNSDNPLGIFAGCGSGGSGYLSSQLTNSNSIVGTGSVPNHAGTGTMTGNEGNGFAKITFIREATGEFEYTGNVQEYIVPKTGTYKLEVWGASGGSLIANGSSITANYNGGKGGYSVGEVKLTKGEKLYIAVGGAGKGATEKGQSLAGGYNGGGSVTGDSSVSHMTASGGGATHIAKTNNRGELKNYASNKNEILIVAGGGGGAREQSNHEAAARWGHGGAGGGLQGQGAVSSNGSTTELTELTQLAGTQTSGKAFGLGGNGSINSAGGGGFYGGYGGNSDNPLGIFAGCGSGGSGYLSSQLTNSNSIVGTRSVPTHTGNGTMTGNEGNGFAKITYIGTPVIVDVVDPVIKYSTSSIDKVNEKVTLEIKAQDKYLKTDTEKLSEAVDRIKVKMLDQNGNQIVNDATTISKTITKIAIEEQSITYRIELSNFGKKVGRTSVIIPAEVVEDTSGNKNVETEILVGNPSDTTAFKDSIVDFVAPVWKYSSKDIYLTNANDVGNDSYANAERTVKIVFKGTDTGTNPTSTLTSDDITVSVNGTLVANANKTLTTTGNGTKEVTCTLIIKGITGNGILNVVIPAGKLTDQSTNTNVQTALTTDVKITIDNTKPTVTFNVTSPVAGYYKAGQVVTITATYNENIYKEKTSNNLIDTIAEAPALKLTFGSTAAKGTVKCTAVNGKVITYQYTIQGPTTAGGTNGDNGRLKVTSLGTVYDAAGNAVSASNVTPSVNITADTINPTITVNPESCVWRNSVLENVTITHNDAGGSGVASQNGQYFLTTSEKPTATGTLNSYTSGTSFSIKPETSGQYYLFVKQISDKVTNKSNTTNYATIGGVVYHRYGLYKFDYEKPTPGTMRMKLGSSDGSNYVSDTWTRQSVYISLNDGSDALSGHESTTYAITKNGAEYVSDQTEERTLSEDGIYVITVTTTDNAGNIATNSYTVKIDKTAPSTPVITNPSGGNWTNQDVTLSAYSDDSGSKVAKIQYSYDQSRWNDAWGDVSGTLTTSGNRSTMSGTWKNETNATVYVRAIDNVGNTSGISSTSLKIDKTKPTITVNPASCTWKNSALSVTITHNDTGGSGVAGTSGQYFLTTSAKPTSTGTLKEYTSGEAFDINPGTSGQYYLFVKQISDVATNKSSTTNYVTIGGVTYHRYGVYKFDYDKPVWKYSSKDIYLSSANDVGNDNYANAERTVKIVFKGTDVTTNATSTLTASNIAVSVNGTSVPSANKTLETTGNGTKEVTCTLTIKGITGNGILNVVIPAGKLKDEATNTNVQTALTTDVNITIDNTKPTVSFNIKSPAAGYYKAGQVVTITATYNENIYKEKTSNNLIDTTAEAPALKLAFGSTAAKGAVTCTAVSGKVITYTYTIQGPTTAGGTDGDNGRLKVTSLGAVYDVAGNAVSASNVTPSINITADTTTPTIAVNPTSCVWRNSALSVTITHNDTGGSGVAGTSGQYFLTTSAEPTSAGTLEDYESGTAFNINPETSGQYYLFVKQISDKAGNGSIANGTTVTIGGVAYQRFGVYKFDYDKPTAGTMTMKLENESGSNYTSNTWTNKSVYIKLNNGHDETNGSGHKSTTYTITKNGAAYVSNQTTARTLSEDGTYVITVTTTDNAGNTATNSYTVKIDKTKPTTPVITNPSGGNWTNQNVTLSAYSDDSGSKVAKIQYSYDQSTWKDDWGTLTTSGNRSTISGTWTNEINKTVYARAIDNAGNVSEISSTPLKIDKTKPTITLGTNKNETWAKTGSVTVTIGDTSSGLATGANMQYAWSTDGTTAPTSGYTTATISSYSAGAKTATFTASASGLTGKYYLWVKPVTLKDVAGNAQTAPVKSTGTFWFDNTAPTIPTYNAFHPSDNKPYASGTWTNYLVNTTIQSTDEHSGVKEIQWSTNKTDWTKLEFSAGALTQSGTTWSGTESWTLKERNDYIYFRAVDNLGNTSIISTTPDFNIRYDLTAPVWKYSSKDIYFTNANDVGNDNYANSERTVKIVFKGTDVKTNATSTLTSDDIAVSVNGTAVPNANKTLQTTNNGTKEVTCTLTIKGITGNGILNVVIPAGKLKDEATNTNVQTALTTDVNITIDNTKPNISFNVTSPAAGYYKAGQVVTITATYNENIYKEKTSNNLIDTTAEAPALKLAFGSTAAKGAVTCTAVSGKVITYTYTIQGPTTVGGTNGDNGRLKVTSLGIVYDAAGNAVSASNVTPSINITADTTNPTMTVNPESCTWRNSALSVTITHNDTGGSGLAGASGQYFLTTSATPTSAGTLKNYTSGTAFSINPGTSGQYYLFVKQISDKAGNGTIASENAVTIGGVTYHKYGVYQFDYDKPTITLGTNKNETWAKTGSVTVTIGDASSGLATGANVEYAWSTDGGAAPTSGYKAATISSYSAGAKTATFTANASGLSGKYYLWVKPVTLKDVAGNAQTAPVKSTGTFWFDNTAPTIPTYNAFHPSDNKPYASGTWTNYLVNTTIQSTDEHSGVKEIQWSTNKTDWTKFEFSAGALTQSGTTWSGTESWTLKERNDYFYFRAIDNLGNTSVVSATPDFNIRYDLTAPVWKYSSKDIYLTTANDVGNDSYANSERTVKIVFKGTDVKTNATSTLTSDDIKVSVNGTAVPNANKTLQTTNNGTKEVTCTLTIKGITGDGILNVVIPAGKLKDEATNTNVQTALTTDVNITIDNTKPNISFNVTSPAAGYYKAGQVVTITATYNENIYKEKTSNNLIDTTAEAPALKLAFGSTAAKGAVTCTAVSGKVITYTYTIQGPTTAGGTNGDNGRLKVTSIGTVYDIAGNAVSASNVTPSVNITADTTKPTITVNPTSCTWRNSALSVTITHNDTGGSGLAGAKGQYFLTTNAEPTLAGTLKEYTSGTAFNINPGTSGQYYLFVKQISDKAGNGSIANGTTVTIGETTYQRFGIYQFDYIKPTIVYSTSSIDRENRKVTLEIKAQDEHLDAGAEKLIEAVNRIKVKMLDQNGNQIVNDTTTISKKITKIATEAQSITYRIELSNFGKNEGTTSVIIPAEVIVDEAGNKNVETEIRVGNPSNSTAFKDSIVDFVKPTWKYVNTDTVKFESEGKISFTVKGKDNFLDTTKSNLKVANLKVIKDGKIYLDGSRTVDAAKITINYNGKNETEKSKNYTIEIAGLTETGTYSLVFAKDTLFDVSGNTNVVTTITFSNSEMAENTERFKNVTYHVAPDTTNEHESYVHELISGNTTTYRPSSLGELFNNGENLLFAEPANTSKSFAGWAEADSNGEIISGGTVYGLYDEIPITVTHLRAVWQDATVIYVSSSSGNNANSGTLPIAPVKDLQTAYRKLNSSGTAENNIIVIMDAVEYNSTATLQGNATITNQYAGVDYRVTNNAGLKIASNMTIQGDITFDNIKLYTDIVNNKLIANSNKNVILGRGITTPNDKYTFGAIGGGQVEPTSIRVEAGIYNSIVAGKTSSSGGTILSGIQKVVIGNKRDALVGNNEKLTIKSENAAIYLRALNGSSGGTVDFEMYSGKVNGDIYGGSSTTKTDIVNNMTFYGGEIGGDIYGGGTNGTSGKVGTSKIVMENKTYSTITFGGSIFGAGPSENCTNSSIYLKNFGKSAESHRITSIERADKLYIGNSNIELTGASNEANLEPLRNYTLSQIGALTIYDNTTLYNQRGFNKVGGFNSYATLNADGTGTKATMTNVKNKLYTLEGVNLVFATEEGLSDKAGQDIWGNVNGMTMFGVYTESASGEKLYDKSLFKVGTYVEGRKKTSHNISVDGFYDADKQVIGITDFGTYYDWIIGEDVVNYSVQLIASESGKDGVAEVVLDHEYLPEAIYTLTGISTRALINANDIDVNLIDPLAVPVISANANNTFGLTVETAESGWYSKGTANIYKNAIVGDTVFESDNSATPGAIRLKIYNSINITEENDLGFINLMLTGKTPDNSKTFKVVISINIKTVVEEHTELQYTPVFTNREEKELNYTTDSRVDLTYTLFSQTATTPYASGDYRVLKTSTKLPAGTRITMKDRIQGKIYYYHVTGTETEYRLSNFLEMDSIDNHYTDSQTYYNSAEKYVAEKYDISIDFLDSNIDANKLAQETYLELRNSSGVVKYNNGDTTIKYNLYYGKNAVMTETISNEGQTYTIGTNTEIPFTLNVSLIEQETADGKKIMDTKYYDKTEGITIEILNGDGNRLQQVENLKLVNANNLTEQYLADKNGVIRVPIIQGLSTISKNYKMTMNSTDVKTGTYSVYVSFFASDNGKLIGDELKVQKEFNVTFDNELPGLVGIEATEGSRIINQSTRLNLEGNSGIDMTINVVDLTRNTNIRVELYKRNKTYTNPHDESTYTATSYTLVDLKDYLEGTWQTPENCGLTSAAGSKEYIILPKQESEESAKTIEFKKAVKANIETGEYKLVIKSYDDNTLVQTVRKTFVVTQ